MRLIDADALFRKVKTECNPYGKPTIGFEDGKRVMKWIEQAPTVGGWISVKDRLPEKYETVLVAIAGHDVIIQKDGETLEEAINRTFREVRYVTTGSIDEDGDWNGSEGYPMMVQPRYWMPFPELPMEGESNG